MKLKTNRPTQLSLILIALAILSFQNCSKVSFSPAPVALTESSVTAAVEAPVVRVANDGTHTKTVKISSQLTKVDFLLVIDNSPSMLEDSVSLAQKLSGFFSHLDSAQIDWQMCVTTVNTNSSGQSYPWQGGNSGILLNSRSGDLQTILVNSVRYLFDSSLVTSDERGVAQTYLHMMNGNNSPCYRNSALFAPIIISDEDERSTGGFDYSYIDPDPANYNHSTGPIEEMDRPDFLISEFARRFTNKKMQAHSIIVKSGDIACFDEQNVYSNPSFGRYYERLTSSTGGSNTSICESDFSKNLNQIATNVISLSQNLQLDCDPVGTPQITTSPADSAVTQQISGRQMTLAYPSNKAYTVTVSYKCQ